MPLLSSVGGGSAKGFGATLPTGYFLGQSLRFRESASAYLNRTPATAGNRTTWTWSAWVKRGNVGDSSYYCLFGVDGVTPNNRTEITFSANAIYIYEEVSSATIALTTTGLFRDPSAWYHIVVAIDTTQATSTNRVKLYVNGEQITSFSSATYPSLNYNTFVNSTNTHVIGARRYAGGTVNKYFDGYMGDVYLIDGQQLTPSNFGKTNPLTGSWIPKKYAGTYGTNGFYLSMNQTVEAYGADYLVVAGGGGGGGRYYSGGGGAGGYLTGTTNLAIGSTYTVTVGAGGSGGAGDSVAGSNGQNSVFSNLTAIGGGGGGSYNSAARTGLVGGSGGGNSGYDTGAGGAGTSGQGNAGGSGATYGAGGGGGAGAIGSNGTTLHGGNGGVGLSNSITGTAIFYAGGGGGSAHDGTLGSGGNGGGGNGAQSGVAPTAGTANTGGGGGGSHNVNPAGNGGSGIVILRVPTAKYTGTVTGSPTVTTDGSDTVIKFTANGSYTA